MTFRLHVALTCLALAQALRGEGLAHAVEGANLQIIAELTEEKLIYEVSAETSLVPPLAHVTFDSDSFPAIDAVRQEVVDYFAEHCPVRIDGIPVRPVLEDIQFERLENQVNLGSVSNFVMAYLFLHYPVKKKPQTADMRWGIFLPEKVNDLVPQEPDPTGHTPQTIDSIFYTFGELDLMTFSPEEPQYVWHNPEPILSVDAQERLRAASEAAKHRSKSPSLLGWLLAGGLALGSLTAGLKQRRGPALGLLAGALAAPILLRTPASTELDAVAALQRFQDLHQNIYRAFDYDSDDAIYDALAQSVDGRLLDTIYADVYRSLILRDEGGAICRVKKLEYVDCVPAEKDPETPGWTFDAHWRVHGLVQHWGHTHQRINEYQARYLMTPEEGLWRIRDVEIREEKRLNPRTFKPVN